MHFIAIPDPYDLVRSFAPLRHGPKDPTTRLGDDEVWRAMRTPLGGATLHLRRVDGGADASASGPGAAWALEHAAAFAGAEDTPHDYKPEHPLLRELHRHFNSVRFPKTGTVLDSLIPAIAEQKVTSTEAFEAWRGLVFAFGERAPGDARLCLPPDPAAVAAAPYFHAHRFGLERRRADVVRAACARAGRMEEAATMSPADARARLQAIPGVGPWTAAEVTRASHGDADAVSVGDLHLPHLVAYALAGEARGTDERMLALLASETGHRGRAIRYLELSGLRAPRFGPRHRIRQIADL